MKKYIIVLFSILLIYSCSEKNIVIPENFEVNENLPNIYPRYYMPTIPANIAPLNFKINEDGEEFICRLKNGESELKAYGEYIKFDLKKWRKFISDNKGKSVSKEVFVKKDGIWNKYLTDSIYISEYEIDPYISYRMIEPSYVSYEHLSIRQRNLTNFEETNIYYNKVLDDGNESNCINCHSYKNYDPDYFQFHVRQYKGGTVICTNGNLKKVDMKCDSLISSGVYPAWHPTKNLIAYSVNDTHQAFHTKNTQKIEVFDDKSDLILYDVDKNEVIPVLINTEDLEVFPFWSPQGTELYYCVSKFIKESDNMLSELKRRYDEVFYDIYKMDFDTVSMKFGEPQIVVNASENNRSATLPRISPDGKYLLYTEGDYGVFHIWHKSSDLFIKDLETGQNLDLKKVNSNDVESYHSWSSNGRWIIFSSRRDDGSYTRPYIVYFGENGKCGMPFILPQEDPNFYPDCYKSFNIPEFMKGPVKVKINDLKKVINSDVKKAKLRNI